MTELISLQPQTVNGATVETVSARELHEFLGSKQDFSTWIKNRISEYGFVENQDFVSLHKKMERENKAPQKNGAEKSMTYDNWQGRIEYYVTLDMAKEISMVERNEKGREARKYFIECEKKLKEQTTPQPVQPIGETEDKLRTIILALEHTTLSDVAKETAIITSAETLTGISIGYRPQIEQTTYSAKELGDVLGISANRVGRIANAHGLKTKEYGLYYLNKSQHSDKQVEHFRYFEKAIDKFKSILETE